MLEVTCPGAMSSGLCPVVPRMRGQDGMSAYHVAHLLEHRVCTLAWCMKLLWMQCCVPCLFMCAYSWALGLTSRRVALLGLQTWILRNLLVCVNMPGGFCCYFVLFKRERLMLGFYGKSQRKWDFKKPVCFLSLRDSLIESRGLQELEDCF